MMPLNEQDRIARKEGTELRILTWNILSEELTPDAPQIEKRIDGICAYILRYLPDAAGIQEISESAYAMLAERIGDVYEFVNLRTKADDHNFTGVAYNKRKYRLLESDVVNYEIGNPRIRLMNILHLEELEGDRRFVLLSTHWDRQAFKRTPHAEQMAEKVLELERLHGVPVICVGDYNARESTAAYRIFMRKSGQVDAKQICAEAVNLCFTGHEVGSTQPLYEGEESIDHVTLTKGVCVLHYEAVINEEVAQLSDHFPVYVDLKL